MILVTGGAGYIGSHAVKQLLEQNYEVVVLDNLSTGHRQAIDKRAYYLQGDVKDEHVLEQLFTFYPIDGVMHFAANCLVGESVERPLIYYENNVAATVTLLKVMMRHQIKRMIFSSTCAVYGVPDVDIIDEACPPSPINPYGRSKWMVEQMLRELSEAYGLSFIALRYFNAAGAHPSGDIGEHHDPETHLIPNILRHLQGKSSGISIFGTDYETPDGTCIRDYIHVNDLANAHILALKRLLGEDTTADVYNLGTGTGYSVIEIINMCEKVSGKQAKIAYGNRRPGDPAHLVASYEKINRELGWKPEYSLEDIIQSAWRWHLRHPDGYATDR